MCGPIDRAVPPVEAFFSPASGYNSYLTIQRWRVERLTPSALAA